MADTDPRDVIVQGARARFSEPVVVQSLSWEEFADAAVADLEAAGLVVVAADREFPIKWIHCTPDFIAHNSCETVPRRACRCPVAGSHDHAVTDWDARAALPVTEETAEWCKCDSCWGWFVEEHPGEDLDELGRDRSWWSGLPEHRDPPALTARRSASEEKPENRDG